MKPRQRGQAGRAADIAERRRRAAEMVRSGMSQNRVALALGVNAGTVSRDLHALRERATVAARLDVTELRDRELTRLDDVDAKAVEHFERSPDPSWLRVRVSVSTRRAKLLGLDEAERIEVTGPDGGPLELRAVPDDLGMVREGFRRLVAENGLQLDEARLALLALGMDRDDVDAIHREWRTRELHEVRELSPAPDEAPDEAPQ